MKIQCPWSGQTNSLFNLRIHKPDINRNYLYGKDPYEAKYQLITSKKENASFKRLNDFKDFI